MLVMSSTFIERSACNGPGSPMTPVADGAAPCRPLEDARLVRQGAVHLPGVAFDPIVPQQPVPVDLPDRGADHLDGRAVRFGAHDAVVAAGDRKSVVEGKSVSVSVDRGGGRISKKKKKEK